jgi:hypothetical protein
MKFAFVAAIALSLPAAAGGATITVGRWGTGQYSDIQPALDVAADGDEVLVKPGDYEVLDPIDFNRNYNPQDPLSPPPKNLVLRSEKGPAETIIRMAATPRQAALASVVIFASGEDQTSRLEGFTISGGWGTTVTFTEGSYDCGGGILCLGTIPILADCKIEKNRAFLGGGVFGAPVILDCIIEGNIAGTCKLGLCKYGAGGGVFGAPDVSGSTIRGNKAGAGGGVYGDALLDGCFVVGNMAELWCSEGQCYDGFGGGVMGNAVAGNCVIAGNFARVGGGVIGSAALVNCTIVGNGTAITCVKEGCFGGLGAAMYCDDTTKPAMSNCLLSANDPSDKCSPGTNSPSIANPRFVRPWIFDFGLFAEVSLGGDKADMPAFIAEEGDYHLLEGSEAIDVGTEQGAPKVDLDGDQRPCGAGVDVGAYEFGDCSAEVQFRRGDVDASGVIDLTDAITLLNHLYQAGEVPTCQAAADADASGLLDLTDAVYSLRYQYLAGDPPVAPFPGCGVAEAAGLPCVSYPACP